MCGLGSWTADPSVDGAPARTVSGVAEKRLRLPEVRPATLPAEATAVGQV